MHSDRVQRGSAEHRIHPAPWPRRAGRASTQELDSRLATSIGLFGRGSAHALEKGAPDPAPAPAFDELGERRYGTRPPV